jgi:hypothetical protein
MLLLSVIVVMLFQAPTLTASDGKPEFIVVAGPERTSASGERIVTFAVLWGPDTARTLPYGGPSKAASAVPREENEPRIQVLHGSTVACSFTVGPTEAPGPATYHGKHYLAIHGGLFPSAAPCRLGHGTYRLRAVLRSVVSLPSAEFIVGSPPPRQ